MMKIKQAILGICASGLLLGGAAWAQGGAGEEQPSQGQMQPQQQQMQQGGQGQTGQMEQFKSNATAQVQKQLQQRTEEYQRAWNNHDVNKMLSFYTPDATLLDGNGQTATGKQDIKTLLQQEQQGPMAQAQVQFELQSVRTITPSVALMDIQQTMTGMTQPQGGPQTPTQFHASVLALKKGNQWQVAAVRAFPSPQQGQMGVGGGGMTGQGQQGQFNQGQTNQGQMNQGQQPQGQGQEMNQPPYEQPSQEQNAPPSQPQNPQQ